MPTGLGKTAGTALAWLYHCVVRKDQQWPRRLVFILPMRVLVEQVERTLEDWISRSGTTENVELHVLMGGVRPKSWVLYPEKPAVLVGTQDMILSRALNRGFAAARGRWPMDFALLHHDALWVLDEVQLMDVGLMTSVQLAAFRDGDAAKQLRPVRCWWMSATLQPGWLKGADSTELVSSLEKRMMTIPEHHRQGGLWTVRKLVERRADIGSASQIAALAAERHTPKTLTLVIVNRVERAVETFAELEKRYSQGTGKKRTLRPDAPDLCLIHSRFRGAERKAWPDEFLHRNTDGDNAMPEAGRILVSTQVIEAGVDISARVLITELAPWSSLVQRAGRAGRDRRDDGAQVIVVGPVPEKLGDALPYEIKALAAADHAWSLLAVSPGDASLAGLTGFEESLERDEPSRLAGLYPYDPEQVLQRSDLDDLFDTTPDLTGADIDVSGFIRTGEERDIRVVWRELGQARESPAQQLSRDEIGTVHRSELCPVPIGQARSKWLRGLSGAYVWDYLDGRWNRLDQASLRRLAPGAVVLVAAHHGGYDPVRGWDGKSTTPVAEARSDETISSEVKRFVDMVAAQDDDSTSLAGFKTIATHGRETADVVAAICQELGLDAEYDQLLALAGRCHDAGKAHRVFQQAIVEEKRNAGPDLAKRRDLAKAPPDAWRQPPYPDRPGFRHELVSTLALFELLRRVDAEHGALLGSHRDLLDAAEIAAVPVSDDQRVAASNPLAGEIVQLTPLRFNLLAYLVCAHHGKVRCSWTGTPRDQESGKGAIHGVCGGDSLARLQLCDRDGEVRKVPELELHLDGAGLGLGGRYGASWTERVGELRAELGIFALAYLETLLRAADHRASQLSTEDPLS